MNVLAFDSRSTSIHGINVRRAGFRRRSLFPLGAACLVANNMRDILATQLGVPVTVRVMEPQIPAPAAWQTLCAGAQPMCVRGNAGEAALLLREADAKSLVAAIFAEATERKGTFSTVELSVLQRIKTLLCGALAPVCGSDLSGLREVSQLRGYTTYFEILVEEPLPFRIGIAVSREPSEQPVPKLSLQDLGELPLEIQAELPIAALPLRQLASLQPGSCIPISASMLNSCTVLIAHVEAARALPGTSMGRRAIVIGGEA